ncbi:MAG: tetratricopeptide repeat protein [Deltaproteobacteria bacterium]|nr:tetratricopeptide repeat protein [Deltaproteobacteria bacterium]
MRSSWILVILLAAGSSEAKPAPESPRAPPVTDGDFWRDVVEPHAEEIRKIVNGARNGIRIADDALQSDSEWAVVQRMRYFEDAYGMLRYARKLAPDNVEVLVMLGRAADEIGKTREAINALETAIQIAGPDKTSLEAVGRLGSIYLRLGDRDAAIRWLRLAQGPLKADSAQALVHLANALAARGEVTAAVDTLVNALPAHNMSFYSQELTLAAFTLALIYDRDEQRSAAFEVLDRMKSALQHSFGTQVQNMIATLRFSPAEDQHYYQGLLYEAMDQYVEARASFALYAASGDTPWRDRALDHVRAIDAHRKKPLPVVKVAPTPPPTPRPQNYHP